MMKKLLMLVVIVATTWGIYWFYKTSIKTQENPVTKYTEGLQRAEQIAQRAESKASLATLKNAISQYHSTHEKYPASLQDLVSSGLLDKLPDGNFAYNPETGEITAN